MRAHPSLPGTEYSQRRAPKEATRCPPELGVTHLKTGQHSKRVKGKCFILVLEKLAAQSWSVLYLQCRAYATEPSARNCARSWIAAVAVMQAAHEAAQALTTIPRAHACTVLGLAQHTWSLYKHSILLAITLLASRHAST